MINYIQPGLLLTVPAPADVDAGELIAVGNLVGVAANDAASTEDVDIQTEGCFRLTKATGFVPVAGEVAYYDFGSDKRLEAYSTNADCRPVGFYTHSALTGDTAARIKLDPVGARAAVVEEVVSIYLAPGSATVKTGAFFAPFDGKIKALKYYADAKPTSSAGSVLLVAQNCAVGPDNTLLNAANFDLEGMTEDALTAFTLTSTAADLVLNKGEVAEFVVTPNNADVVAGTGIHIHVVFERTDA